MLIIMASKSCFQIFLLLLCFSNFPSKSTAGSETESYNKWLAWNVQNYQRKAMWEAETATKKPSYGGKLAVDRKLATAEMNKVIITISQDSSGDYKTVGEAISTIPPRNKKRVVLIIKPGIYREKVTVARTLPFVTFLGDANDPPIITGNDTASTISRKDGKQMKTFQSATIAIDADYFVATNIKFENTAPHEIGSMGSQAVAIRISGTKAAFYNCSFYGSQDTLYDHKGLHYFHNCFIQGSVDFIFGYGRSLYENCYLNSVAKKVASLTAQKRSNASIASGFSFKDCVVNGSGMVYLGRAWGDYSRVVFSYTYMDKNVISSGWCDWGDQKRDSRVYYGEYKCSGPGANSTGRVPWAKVLTDEEAQPFLGTYYVEGETWLVSSP